MFFKQIYKILIDKEKAPKLAGFIKIIGIDRFEKITSKYVYALKLIKNKS
ncbi:lysyl-tRNA synthetase [Borreliella burgdorferi WI91-23]|nr:lysyl-tRNA synthetase [Borreliella burgdorferi WI91-23]